MKIVNTTSLAGKKGSMAKLTDESIQIETNLDVDQKRILIRIVAGPQHGIIRVTCFFPAFSSTYGLLIHMCSTDIKKPFTSFKILRFSRKDATHISRSTSKRLFFCACMSAILNCCYYYVRLGICMQHIIFM